MKRVLVGLAAAVAITACTNWDSVKSDFCASHAGEGNCPANGSDAGADAGEDAGQVAQSEFDGGPPVDWLQVLGGISNDQLDDLKLNPGGFAELAASGSFTGAIDFGGGVVSAPSPSAPALFLLTLAADSGTIGSAYGIRCGLYTGDPQTSLAWGDGGLLLGATCFSASPVVDDGVTVQPIDAGNNLPPGQLGLDPVVLRLNNGVFAGELFKSPNQRAAELRAVAGDGLPYFYVAVNEPLGSEVLGADGGVDAGNSPLMARMGVETLAPELVSSFDCPHVEKLAWEALATDSTGDSVMQVYRRGPSPGPESCSLTIPGQFTGSGSSTSQPGLERVLVWVSNRGVTQHSHLSLGQISGDGGFVHLAVAGPTLLYVAGLMSANVGTVFRNSPAPTVASIDLQLQNTTALHAFAEGPRSAVSINDIAVVPGASPQIWITGSVRGELREVDGGAVLASHDEHSDGFLIRLSPTTLSPVKTVVFGTPGRDEEGRKLIVRPPFIYVGGTVTAPPNGEGPYSFGGKTATLNGGSDVLLFRMPIPQ
ncbi:MAG: hypothetical protein ACJ790_07030 [Myxococcaceae bacterium]